MAKEKGLTATLSKGLKGVTVAHPSAIHDANSARVALLSDGDFIVRDLENMLHFTPLVKCI